METLQILRWFHLVAAATWTGGLITLGALVAALRRAGADRELLRAAARMFGKVSWTAMAVLIATGLAQVSLMGMSWSYGRLHLKLTLVAVTVLLAAYHQRTAASASPGHRGAIQVLILIASLAVFGAAIML